jgi:predicted acyl esterase
MLGGWMAFPNLSPGERAPVLLISSPYFGEISGNPFVVRRPDDQSLDDVLWSYFEDWDQNPNGSQASDAMTHSAGFPLIRLIRRGYVVALFNVRGTGRSEGCFEFGGHREQQDQAHLVEWLAAQPWSNERVAMAGLSYPAWTAWQAAVQRPPHLVATVTGGDVSDPFLFAYTPQGAASTFVGGQLSSIRGTLGAGLGLLSDQTDKPPHVCPQSIATGLGQFGGEYASGERAGAYWDERRLVGRMHNVRAATLSAHGFWDFGHGYQDSLLWEALPHARKRFVRGWWAHHWPIPTANGLYADDRDFTTLDETWEDPDWESIATRWLDYWLKGVGSPGRIDTIDVLEGDRSYGLPHGWKTSRQVLYLGGGELRPTPGGASQSFADTPHLGEHVLAARDSGLPISHPGLCPNPDPLAAYTYAVYRTQPLTEDVVIGGNPFAYVRLSSDGPAGVVNVHLAALAPGFDCDAAGRPTDPSTIRWITTGAADLQHHATPYIADDFAIGKPTQVRVDLTDTFVRIPAGYRLVAAIGYGDVAWDRLGPAGRYPRITVLADGGALASQLVIPVFEDTTLGGRHPTLEYPRRPFAPAGYR